MPDLNTAWTGLANNALVLIGVPPILDFTDQTTEANAALTFYPVAKRAVLRMHDWNFAKVQAILSPLSNVPILNYSNAYQLPKDNLRVLNAFLAQSSSVNIGQNVSGFPYQIYQNQLLCSKANVGIEYIQDISDPTLIDSLCFEAMSLWLAMKLSFTLLQSQQNREELMKMFKEVIEKAKTVDSLENSNTIMDAELLLQSRVQGPPNVMGTDNVPNVSTNPY